MDEEPKPKKPPIDLPRAPKPGEAPHAPPPVPPQRRDPPEPPSTHKALRALCLVAAVVMLACGRDSPADRDRAAGVSGRTIGPLPTDTLNAALDDYRDKRISADSAAAIITSYQRRTGRTVNIEMDAALLAAMQRRSAP